MKKIFFILGLGALLFTQSCSYDDKSTTSDKMTPEISIWIPADDDEEASYYDRTRYYVEFGDSIEFAPEIRCEGCTNEDFECEWTMSLATYSLVQVDKDNFEVLSHEPVLRWRVNRDPNSSQGYGFRLRVKNKKTGIYYQRTWSLFVNEVSKQGLLVADSQDGATSDLHVIQDEGFYSWQTWEPSKKTILKNMYSKANGSKYPGIILGMRYRNHPFMGQVKNFIKMFSKDNLCDIFSLDYTIYRIGLENFFYDIPQTKDIQALFTYDYQNYNEYIINNGGIYSRACETNKDMTSIKYNIPSQGSPAASEASGVEPTSRLSKYYAQGVFAVVFDEIKQKVYCFNSMSWTSQGAFQYTKDITAPDLVGRTLTALGAEEGDAAKIFIFRDVNTNDYFYFTVGNTGSSQRAVLINDAPAISDAKYFLPTASQKQVFYATNNKLYSMVCQTGMAPTYKELYTFPEEVNGIYRLKYNNYNNASRLVQNGGFVVTTTSGQTNGNVYLFKIGPTNTGTVDGEPVKYTGFNRISAVALVD